MLLNLQHVLSNFTYELPFDEKNDPVAQYCYIRHTILFNISHAVQLLATQHALLTQNHILSFQCLVTYFSLTQPMFHNFPSSCRDAVIVHH